MIPDLLHAFEHAIEIGTLVTDRSGYRARGHPGSPFVSQPNLPPYDGRYWSSYTEPGIFVRLDLCPATLPAELVAELRRRYPDQVGADGALYEYERSDRRQMANRDLALARLANRVAACAGDGAGGP